MMRNYFIYNRSAKTTMAHQANFEQFFKFAYINERCNQTVLWLFLLQTNESGTVICTQRTSVRQRFVLCSEINIWTWVTRVFVRSWIYTQFIHHNWSQEHPSGNRVVTWAGKPCTLSTLILLLISPVLLVDIIHTITLYDIFFCFHLAIYLEIYEILDSTSPYNVDLPLL